MLYDYFKIFHIVSATVLLTSLAYCYRLWRDMQPNQLSRQLTRTSRRIQTQTWLIIIPATLIQLATGFTMISLKHYDLSEIWLSGSILGFIGVVGSWFGFIYFLLLSEQLVTDEHHSTHSVTKYHFFRRIQSTLLGLCLASVMSMVFFMANKAT